MIGEQTQNTIDMLSEELRGNMVKSISIREGPTGIQEIKFVLKVPKEKRDCIVGIAGRDLGISFGSEQL